MAENEVLTILKNAILLEKRGKVFYERVAAGKKKGAVKDFFEMMAKEETEHIRILENQFEKAKNNQPFQLDIDLSQSSSISDNVLTDQIKAEIKGADFEAAAISAAISMEEKAENFYHRRANTATDSEEKKLYNWLAKWEEKHLEMLVDIDKELTEEIWLDNQFWPY
ncbi:MAG: ferritin family protein [Spirochaetes bacterium]|nr:ferritin family protein [Spirochaetota bacterium]